MTSPADDAVPSGGTPAADSTEPLCDRARRLLVPLDRPSGRDGDGDGSAPDGQDPVDDPLDDPHGRAEVLLRRAVAQDEWSAPGLLASLHLDRGARGQAVEVLTPAVHRDGRHDLAGLLGETLTELGDHEAAEAAFLRGLDAGDPSATNGYGLFLWGRGRTQEAAYVLDRAARAGDDLAPLNLVTLHLEELDDPVGAAVVAQEFHDEERPSTLVALADVRLATGRVDDAEALYRRATELGAEAAHTYYGWFLQDRREDLEGAEEQLRLAHEHREPRAALHLARLLLDTGRPDDAHPLLEEAAGRGDRDAAALLDDEYGGTVDPWDD